MRLQIEADPQVLEECVVARARPLHRNAEHADTMRHPVADARAAPAPVVVARDRLRRAKDISMNCLTKKSRTSKFRRFANSEVLDRFLLAAGAYFEALFRSQQEPDGDSTPERAGQTRGGLPGPAFLERTSVENDHYEVQLRGKEMAMACLLRSKPLPLSSVVSREP